MPVGGRYMGTSDPDCSGPAASTGPDGVSQAASADNIRPVRTDGLQEETTDIHRGTAGRHPSRVPKRWPLSVGIQISYAYQCRRVWFLLGHDCLQLFNCLVGVGKIHRGQLPRGKAPPLGCQNPPDN